MFECNSDNAEKDILLDTRNQFHSGSKENSDEKIIIELLNTPMNDRRILIYKKK